LQRQESINIYSMNAMRVGLQKKVFARKGITKVMKFCIKNNESQNYDSR